MPTLMQRPTRRGEHKQAKERVLRGPWGSRTIEPMTKVQLYGLLWQELINDGILPGTHASRPTSTTRRSR